MYVIKIYKQKCEASDHDDRNVVILKSDNGSTAVRHV